MAEIRKHKTSSNPIAAALAAAMGEPIRPVTPGARPAGAEEDDDRPEAAGPASLSVSTGWQGFTVTSVPPVVAPRVADAASEDEGPDDSDPDDPADGA
ncbi:hypothetical protein [Acidipropionibacterium jensenii]|uniref:hypothetical protein n=1 Tax=Acidipropionibacterium jensenii TaxID=1749 RepID=UPI00214B3E3C|nr:hypothetical protein [Acidipropionibacterium jensenii]